MKKVNDIEKYKHILVTFLFLINCLLSEDIDFKGQERLICLVISAAKKFIELMFVGFFSGITKFLLNIMLKFWITR